MLFHSQFTLPPRRSALALLTTLILLHVLGGIPLQAESPPRCLWARQSVGGIIHSGGLAVDPNGNCYWTGLFVDSPTIAGVTLTNRGLFLLKYDPAGNLLWISQQTGFFPGLPSLALDSASGVYLVSAFGFATVDIDGITLTNNGNGAAAFVAKFNSDGVLQWAKVAGCGLDIAPNGIAVDAEQNCCWTGAFLSGPATFGTNMLTGGFRGLVVAKHDTEGDLLWAKGANGSEAAGSGIQADAQGNVYVSGAFSGTANLGNTNLTSVGAGDVFLAKYAANGDLVWARQAGGTNYAGNVQGLGLDQTAHCFWAAECQGAVDFSGVSLGQSTTQAFVAVTKYDLAGNLIWAKEKPALERRAGHGMTADVHGNTYLLDFESSRVSKHDSGGDTVWTRSFAEVVFGRVATDASGNCYFTGSFQGASFEFDGITVTNAGNLTGFVTKLETTTPPPLSIATAGNFVTLAWSALAENFYIESTPELGPATVWSSNEVGSARSTSPTL